MPCCARNVACDGHIAPGQKGIREMRVSHALGQLAAVFDDPNLVSCGGLAAVVALGQQCGLAELVADKLTLTAAGGADARVKIPPLIAGMVAGVDSLDDMELLWHGGMDRLFTGVYDSMPRSVS
jgi:hypothetical protein